MRRMGSNTEDQPASACSANQIEDICRYGRSIELLMPFNTLHKLLNDDEFRQSSNTTAIFIYLMLVTAWPRLIARIRRYLPSDSKQRPRSLLVVFVTCVTFVTRGAAMTNPKPTLSNRETRAKHPRLFDTDCTSLFCTFRSGVVSANTSAS